MQFHVKLKMENGKCHFFYYGFQQWDIIPPLLFRTITLLDRLGILIRTGTCVILQRTGDAYPV